MNRSITFIYLFILILLTQSCNESQRKAKLEENNSSMHIIPKEIDLSKNSPNVHSKFIELETNENCALSGITKVIFKDSLFYVMDEKFDNVFIFNSDGKFINHIGDLGKGPGEYLSVEDIGFGPDSSSIFILSNDSEKLIAYSLHGEYKKDIKNGIKASAFGTVNNSLFFYINRNITEITQNNNLIKTDLDGKVIDRFFPFATKDVMAVSFSGFISKNSDGLLYNPSFSDTVFQITNTNVQPKYIFSYGSENIPEDRKDNISKIMAEAFRFAYLGKTFFEVKDGILFQYKEKNEMKTTLFDFKSKTKTDFLYPLNNLAGRKDNNSLIACVQPSVLIQNKDEPFVKHIYKDYPDLANLMKSKEMSDNPILMTFELN